MDEDYLQLAYHYQEANQPEKALNLLESHPQSIEREDHLEHFLLLNVSLFMLDRFDEAGELSDQILRFFPQNERAIHNWIWVNMHYAPRANEAYQMSKTMIAQFPENSFYAYAIALMCFKYHLGNDHEMVSSIERSIQTNSDYDSLYLAYQIFQKLKRPKEQQFYIRRLVAEYPDNELTQQALAKDLFNQRVYRESIHVALSAIRSYPDNLVLVELLRKAENKLFANRLNLLPIEWVVQVAEYVESRKVRLGAWAKLEQICLTILLYTAWLFATVMMIFLTPFSLAENIFFNERILRKRSKDHDFGQLNSGTDTILDCYDGVLVWNPQAVSNHQFILMNHEKVVMAKRVLAPIDQFQYELDLKQLKNTKVIPHKKIGQIKFSNNEVIIGHKISGKQYPVELSSHSTMEHLQEFIESVGFKPTKTKQRSRLTTIVLALFLFIMPLTIHNVFPQKGWFLIYIQMVLVFNITYFLIYRMVFPLKFKIYKPHTSNCSFFQKRSKKVQLSKNSTTE